LTLHFTHSLPVPDPGPVPHNLSTIPLCKSYLQQEAERYIFSIANPLNATAEEPDEVAGIIGDQMKGMEATTTVPPKHWDWCVLYLARFLPAPVAAIAATAFGKNGLDKVKNVNYIKEVTYHASTAATFRNSPNPLTSERFNSIKPKLSLPIPPAAMMHLNALNPFHNLASLPTSLPQGGLTSTLPEVRHIRDVALFNQSKLYDWFWHTAGCTAISVEATKQGVGYGDVCRQIRCDPASPVFRFLPLLRSKGTQEVPVDRLALFLGVGEHLAASITITTSSTQLAKPGLPSTAALPPPQSYLPPHLFLALNAIHTLSTQTPVTLAIVNLAPPISQAALIPSSKGRWLISLVEQAVGCRLTAYPLSRRAREASNTHPVELILCDGSPVPKTRNIAYDLDVPPDVLTSQLNAHVFEGRSNPSSIVVLILASGALEAGVSEFSGLPLIPSEFHRALLDGAQLFTSPFHSRTPPPPLGQIGLFIRLGDAPELAAAALATVAGAYQAAVELSSVLESSLPSPPADLQPLLVDVLHTSSSGLLLKSGHCRELILDVRFSLFCPSPLLTNLPHPLGHSCLRAGRRLVLNLNTILAGLDRSGLHFAINDFDSLPLVVRLGKELVKGRRDRESFAVGVGVACFRCLFLVVILSLYVFFHGVLEIQVLAHRSRLSSCVSSRPSCSRG
jgi:hypothetical protein